MRRIVTMMARIGLVISAVTGLTGCGGPSANNDYGQVNTDEMMRRAMDRCGVSTPDLYMIDLGSIWSSPLSREFQMMDCADMPQWLADYRAEHEPRKDFMLWNPPELEPPHQWSDLRYLALSVSSRDVRPKFRQVLVDFDAGEVLGRVSSFGQRDRLDIQPLRSEDAQVLVSLLESTTPQWPYPVIRETEVLPPEMDVNVWSIAIVTRDKRLYRFQHSMGYGMAPPGFIDIYNAFWALTTP